MNVVKDVSMAGYSQNIRALITDQNGEKWIYDLQFNTVTWEDEADYLDNATTDFENEWEVLLKLGKTIHSTELFEKITEENEEDYPINY